MAAGMATGKAWFKVPSAIKFNIVGKPAEWISGKDVILTYHRYDWCGRCTL